MEPDFVANEVVKGILMEKPEVVLPWWSKSIMVMKSILPTLPFIQVAQTLGFNCSMDQFEGRKLK